jgi:hypothetical protein
MARANYPVLVHASSQLEWVFAKYKPRDSSPYSYYSLFNYWMLLFDFKEKELDGDVNLFGISSE